VGAAILVGAITEDGADALAEPVVSDGVAVGEGALAVVPDVDVPLPALPLC